MKTFIFLAEGFEEIEAIAPIDIFRRAGIDVITISVSSHLLVCGAHGISLQADELFENADFTGSDLLFLPGGMPGTKNLDAHEGLKALLRKHANENKKLAAICAAPSIIGKMGLLEGKEAICYPGFESSLFGAELSENKIVKSGSVFTAKGAGVAVQFALKLVAELKGVKFANDIANSICL